MYKKVDIRSKLKIISNLCYILCSFQLVVKDAIESCKYMEKLLKKCRRIARFFHHSASAEQKLKKEQMKHLPDLKPLRLVRDVATRWNSEYDMMNRLLEVRRPLSAVLSDA